jgi:organic radical activating enzyme
MNDVIALFEEAEKKGIPVTGIRGRLSRLSDEASAFLNLGGEPGTATKIKNMIEVVKNRQIREILGESGRTISDLDRRIVDKVFGEIDLTTSPEIALKKLRDAREQLKSSARQYQRDIRTGGTALALPQSGQLGQTYLSQYSDLINDILKVDVDQLDVAGYNPTVGARVVKMTLAEVKGD